MESVLEVTQPLMVSRSVPFFRRQAPKELTKCDWDCISLVREPGAVNDFGLSEAPRALPPSRQYEIKVLPKFTRKVSRSGPDFVYFFLLDVNLL